MHRLVAFEIHADVIRACLKIPKLGITRRVGVCGLDDLQGGLFQMHLDALIRVVAIGNDDLAADTEILDSIRLAIALRVLSENRSARKPQDRRKKASYASHR